MNKKKIPTLIAKADGDVGEIRMYGDVTSDRWSWGSEETISPKAFKEALDELGDVGKVNIHLNSVGGDAYAGLAISNAIRNLKAETEVIVDGIAASAGSVIMCGADKVTVNPSSIVMIHGTAVGLYGYYNAQDLTKAMQSAEAVNKSMLSVYEGKTGKTAEELTQMIEDETWMVGQEIVDNGFADSLVGGEATAMASLTVTPSRKILSVNGFEMDVTHRQIPEELLKSAKSADDEDEDENPFKKGDEDDSSDESEDDDKKKDDDKEDDSDAESKKKCNSSAEMREAERITAAVAAERKRLMEIDAIADKIGDRNLIHKAKYESGIDAKELSYQWLLAMDKKQANANAAFLEDLEADVKESNVDDVNATNAPMGKTKEEAIRDEYTVALIQAAQNYTRGR